MAKYQKFEDLPVWQEAARLYNRVLDLLEEPGVHRGAGPFAIETGRSGTSGNPRARGILRPAAHGMDGVR